RAPAAAPRSTPRTSAARPGRPAGGASGLEALPAAAAGGRVRVVDDEPGPLEALLVVELGSEEVRDAEAVDDDPDALALDDLVAVRGLAERQLVLEARAPAGHDLHAQPVALVRLRGDEGPELVACRRCECDHRVALPAVAGSFRTPMVGEPTAVAQGRCPENYLAATPRG